MTFAHDDQALLARAEAARAKAARLAHRVEESVRAFTGAAAGEGHDGPGPGAAEAEREPLPPHAGGVTAAEVADLQAEVEEMREAAAGRAVIEQAKGVLMYSSGCSPDEAFQMLSGASQRLNRRVRDLAADIVERARKRENPVVDA